MAATIESRLRRATRRLSREVDQLSFDAPVTHVYNPLDYAWAVHRSFIQRYGTTRKRVIYLGMNPGPFGMAQTGIPFGAVTPVRDFLGIEERVGRPAVEHPKRPIQGFACERREVSGARVWGTIRERHGSAARFFRDAYLLAYCPLVFMEESGRNRTPDKLSRSERDALYAVCDRHLRSIVGILEPDWVVGMGVFAERRARQALTGPSLPRLAGILHPSPASPAANQGWARKVLAQLQEQGVCG